jgi:hypothetical protein
LWWKYARAVGVKAEHACAPAAVVDGVEEEDLVGEVEEVVGEVEEVVEVVEEVVGEVVVEEEEEVEVTCVNIT